MGLMIDISTNAETLVSAPTPPTHNLDGGRLRVIRLKGSEDSVHPFVSGRIAFSTEETKNKIVARNRFPVKYLPGDRYDYASCAVVHETAIPYLDVVASDPQRCKRPSTLIMEKEYDAE
jgi:hypothetical protein